MITVVPKRFYRLDFEVLFLQNLFRPITVKFIIAQ